MERFDSVVIGAGPAGLSAAVELSSHGRCLIIDEGKAAPQRSRQAPRELLSGVGGAGLFSDGKHSFFPAATGLWTLPDEAARRSAFDKTAALLARFGVDAGPLPEKVDAATITPGLWQPKAYPSIYVSLADRFQMIDALWTAIAHKLLGARVIDAERRGDEIEVNIEREDQRTSILTKNLVIATGRWSPRWMKSWLTSTLGVNFTFLRCEFGVRIETSAQHPLFARLPGVDGKLRFFDPQHGLEFRTFCTCRNGEVVLGESDSLRAFSGRADGPPTGRSNLGLLVRTNDEGLGREVAAAISAATPESLPLADWRTQGASRLTHLLGPRGAQAMSLALNRIEEFCPELANNDAQLHAPALEGIGEYPICDASLQAAKGVWIAGDTTGRFRGIVAAMISGRYVAQRIVNEGAR